MASFVKWSCGCVGISTTQGDFLLRQEVSQDQFCHLEEYHSPLNTKFSVMSSTEIEAILLEIRNLILDGQKYRELKRTFLQIIA